jgi:hypothetical protein
MMTAKAELPTTRPAPWSRIELLTKDWLKELRERKTYGTLEECQNLALLTRKSASDAMHSTNLQHDLEGFVGLVELLKEIEGLVSATELLTLGTVIMISRPNRPYDWASNKPVEANDGTPTVIELFGLLSKHAVDGFDSVNCVNATHVLRQVLAQHAHLMSVEQMKPFLEASPTLTWKCKETVNIQATRYSPESAYFRSQELLSTRREWTLPNQALVALLQNSFPEGPEGCDPADVLVGGSGAESFDKLTSKLFDIANAGIKIGMKRTDVVLISQILERMTHIVTVEAGTDRAKHYATALVSLIDMVLPQAPKINSKNCIYAAVGIKKNPMCDDGFFNTCTLRALKVATVPEGYPEAVEALENFRYQVLLHTVHISPTLRKYDDFNDDDHIAELADLCSASLARKTGLQPLSGVDKLNLVRWMHDGPVRRQLMTDNMKVRKEIFMEDLGL